MKRVAASVVVPVYANSADIPRLLGRLKELAPQVAGGLEVVFVVDGSPDDSYEVLRKALPRFPVASQLIRLSRNFGSFAAIRTGIAHARGGSIAVMAADLQEPPELILEFLRVLAEDEVDVVVGRREGRSDPIMSRISSSLFWGVYRRIVSAEVPSGGVDIFACNRAVADEILRLEEAHTSLIGLLYWVGFRRAEVPYTRLERQNGASGWTLRKKVRYLLDSVFGFTDLPLILLIGIGSVGAVVTAVIAIVVLVAYLLGEITEPGYTPLMLVILFSTFVLLVALGIVGSYVWRAYENTKRRPGAIVMSRWSSDAGHP